ncbi:MAG: insulinase family protein, partial [Pseudomonadota bacterium]
EYLGGNPATEDELNKIKDNNTLSLAGRWESGGAVLSDIAQIVTNELPDDYWDSYVDTVRNVTLDDVASAGENVIKPDSLVWVIVGDREQIESRVRELELGEITFLDADGNEIVPTAAN